MEKNKFIEELNKLGIVNCSEIAEKLTIFMNLVLERNEQINLTTITEEDEFIEKHFIDSLICYGWQEIESAKNIVDIGTGAGFPGIPLALVYPEKQFLLVDSLGKRIEFLKNVLDVLQISNVELLHSRAEDTARDLKYRGKFDLVASRAVAKLSVLSEYCIPLLKIGGYFYAYKTNKAINEISDSDSARYLLGAAKVVEIRSADIFSEKSEFGHCIMILKKERPTPKTYPRQAGKPAKVPL